MMGLMHELTQPSTVSQRRRLDDLACMPAFIRNMTVWNGNQHSVKAVTIAREVNITRTEIATNDDVTGPEMLEIGIT